MNLVKAEELPICDHEIIINDDGIMDIPKPIMEELGWEVGDELVWVDRGDGSFSLKKYTATN